MWVIESLGGGVPTISARDGMYALVKTTGTIVFRLDYRLHGRRETLTIGQYGRDGITPASAYAKARIVTAGVKFSW